MVTLSKRCHVMAHTCLQKFCNHIINVYVIELICVFIGFCESSWRCVSDWQQPQAIIWNVTYVRTGMIQQTIQIWFYNISGHQTYAYYTWVCTQPWKIKNIMTHNCVIFINVYIYSWLHWWHEMICFLMTYNPHTAKLLFEV